MTNEQYTFTLKDMFFPLITSGFSHKKRLDKENSFKIAYKIVIEIISSKEIEILFGIQVNPKDSTGKNKIVTVVETLGVFNFSDEVFKNNITSVNSIKALPNMLAILFPFIREKIYSCFYNNRTIFYLPSINTFKLVKDLGDKIVVVDKREASS